MRLVGDEIALMELYVMTKAWRCAYGQNAHTSPQRIDWGDGPISPPTVRPPPRRSSTGATSRATQAPIAQPTPSLINQARSNKSTTLVVQRHRHLEVRPIAATRIDSRPVQVAADGLRRPEQFRTHVESRPNRIVEGRLLHSPHQIANGSELSTNSRWPQPTRYGARNAKSN